MPALFLSYADGNINAGALARLSASLERQGFVRDSAAEIADGRVQVRFWPTESKKVLRSERAEWGLVCIGPTWTVLSSLEDVLIQAAKAVTEGDLHRAGAALRQLRGSFAVLIVLPHARWVYTDPLGGIQLFHDPIHKLVSSSFLSLIELQPRAAFDRTGVLQYLLAEAPHGGRTIVSGIEVLAPGHLISLTTGKKTDLWSDFWESPQAPPASIADATEQISTLLLEDFRSMRQAGHDRASVALSGGFDSRLVLALALEVSIEPNVFVYGDAQSADVRIAQQICEAEGLSLTHTDKAELSHRISPALSSEQGLDFFDGYCADGCLDGGVDRMTRLQQAADGRVILNGGGGEILRNFFHLGQGHFAASQIVDAFYSQFPPRILRSRSDHHAYRQSMIEGLQGTVGCGAELMSRRQIELLYPLFRCRWWMSRNNAIANRTGPFLTPLLSPEVIRLASAVNIDWKRAGRLESAVIHRISPSLAKHTSAYGFGFHRGPGVGALLVERLHELRPTQTRPAIAAYGYARRHRMMQPKYAESSEKHGSSSIQRRLFTTDAIISTGMARRLLNIEALADRFKIDPDSISLS